MLRLPHRALGFVDVDAPRVARAGVATAVRVTALSLLLVIGSAASLHAAEGDKSSTGESPAASAATAESLPPETAAYLDRVQAELEQVLKPDGETLARLVEIHEAHPQSQRAKAVLYDSLTAVQDWAGLISVLTRRPFDTLTLNEKGRLGYAYNQSGDHERAAAIYGPLIREHPDNMRVVMQAAVSHYMMADYPAAHVIVLKHWDGLQQVDAHLTHIIRAVALMDSGQLQKAERYFLAAIQVKPDSYEAHLNLGRLHAQLGNAELATRYATRAGELIKQMKAFDTWRESIQNVLSNWRKRDYATALQWTRRMIDSSDHPRATAFLYLVKARIETEMGDNESAAKSRALSDEIFEQAKKENAPPTKKAVELMGWSKLLPQ